MRKMYLLMVILLAFAGCTKFDEPEVIEEDSKTETRVVIGDDEINPAALRASAGVPNPKNPYSYVNMRKAAIFLTQYIGKAYNYPAATHEYVRFLPKDSVQLRTLRDELKLELFDYPFDRELTDEEMEFYQNDIVNGYSCWKYTVVPKLYWVYPADIQKEIVDQVCLPRDNIPMGIPDYNYDIILNQAMKTAGMEIVGDGSATSSYEPKAIIKMQDDANNNQVIPLEGLKIRINTLLNVGIGYTNEKGEVTIPKGWGGKFRNPVRYKIQFESDYWVITNSWMFMAQIEGPKTTHRWDYTIQTNNNAESAFASVHRALHYFYYTQVQIRKPTSNPFRLEVHMSWNHHGLNCAGFVIPIAGLLPLVPDVVLYGKNSYSGDYYERWSIFSSALHELGHISNFAHNIKTALDGKVRESYARAVQYYFMNQFYGENVNFHNKLKPTYSSENPDYTVVGESLFNQGFSLADLTSAFLQACDWDDWRDYCRNMNIAPGWAVNMIFDNPAVAWTYNIEKDAFSSSAANNKGYINAAVLFSIKEELRPHIVSAAWTTSDTRATISSKNGKDTNITFGTKGQQTVTCEIKLPDNIIFKCTKTVDIEDFPQVIGEASPRLGVLYDYEMSDYAFFKNWEILRSKGGVFRSCSTNELRRISARNDKTLSFLILKQGEYVVRATNQVGDKIVKVDFPITVSSEGIPMNPKDSLTSFYSVASFGHKDYPSLIRRNQILVSMFRLPRDYVNLGSQYTFMALNRTPVSRDYPYYSDLILIYCYEYTGGGVAYSSDPIMEWDRDEGKGFPLTKDPKFEFCIFRTQKPGMIPIYTIETITYSNDILVRRDRFLSTEEINEYDRYSGEYKYQTKNIGIAGYAFPYL